MIAHRNYVAPTKAESARIGLMLQLGCVCCAIARYEGPEKVECHHIVEGKRLGHRFTLPLCKGHHRGEWSARQLVSLSDKFRVAISDGKKAFVRSFGTERKLWEGVQRKLGLSTEWVATKILPRRVA